MTHLKTVGSQVRQDGFSAFERPGESKMAQNAPHKQRNFLARCLAAVALLGIYCVSIVGTSAVMLGASSTAAQARGGGRGRGGGWGRGRGGGWGRGRGVGFYGAPIVAPGCYYSRRWGRVVCPY
jgi:hypothetical protein